MFARLALVRALVIFIVLAVLAFNTPGFHGITHAAQALQEASQGK